LSKDEEVMAVEVDWMRETDARLINYDPINPLEEKDN
jgi:hypothetical protein